MISVKYYQVILMIFFLSILTCKNQEKKVESEVKIEKEIINKNVYSFKVTLTSNTEDIFKFVFLNTVREETLVKVKVLKSDSPQTIEANLEVDFDLEFPMHAYLGLGNIIPKTVNIQQVELSYQGNTKIYYPKDFKNNFEVNQYIDQGKTAGEYITKLVNNKHVPIFSLKKETINSVKPSNNEF